MVQAIKTRGWFDVHSLYCEVCCTVFVLWGLLYSLTQYCENEHYVCVLKKQCEQQGKLCQRKKNQSYWVVIFVYCLLLYISCTVCLSTWGYTFRGLPFLIFASSLSNKRFFGQPQATICCISTLDYDQNTVFLHTNCT